MSWLMDIFRGYPEKANPDEIMADMEMAQTLYRFYTACMTAGFNQDQAFVLTITMFECSISGEDGK